MFAGLPRSSKPCQRLFVVAEAESHAVVSRVAGATEIDADAAALNLYAQNSALAGLPCREVVLIAGQFAERTPRVFSGFLDLCEVSREACENNYWLIDAQAVHPILEGKPLGRGLASNR